MGNRIKSERVALGLNQEQLASKLGISIGTVSNWERGEVDITASRLVIMRNLFNCSIDYLLGISDERKPI